MSKTFRQDSEPRVKPRTLKRLRQRESMQQARALEYPQPETQPVWKPMASKFPASR